MLEFLPLLGCLRRRKNDDNDNVNVNRKIKITITSDCFRRKKYIIINNEGDIDKIVKILDMIKSDELNNQN
jgi:hypothetical protein